MPLCPESLADLCICRLLQLFVTPVCLLLCPQRGAPQFAVGDIALYKQFDGKVRRVEVVDVEEDELTGYTRYSVELDATVRVTTADRLSHIPKVRERRW